MTQTGYPIDTLQLVRYKSANNSMASTILIADDHDDNRELLYLLLLAAGYKVLEARDGSECVTLARSHLPDLIVIDLSMPILDGWGVFRELKTDDRTRTIPCIAVTAHAELNRIQALETGFNAYISKPFSSEMLLKTVASFLPDKKSATT